MWHNNKQNSLQCSVCWDSTNIKVFVAFWVTAILIIAQQHNSICDDMNTWLVLLVFVFDLFFLAWILIYSAVISWKYEIYSVNVWRNGINSTHCKNNNLYQLKASWSIIRYEKHIHESSSSITSFTIENDSNYDQSKHCQFEPTTSFWIKQS